MIYNAENANACFFMRPIGKLYHTKSTIVTNFPDMSVMLSLPEKKCLMSMTNDKNVNVPFTIAMNDQYLSIFPENEEPYTMEITWDYQEPKV